MSKKLSDAQIKALVLVLVLITPFIFSYIGIALGMEWQGRFLGISIGFLAFPLILTWLALNPKYKDSWGFTYNGKRYHRPGRIFGLLVAIPLLIGSRYLVLDMITVVANGPVMETGVVADTTHNPYSVIVRGQWIQLEKDSTRKFFAAFNTFWIKADDKVQIKYLPNTKYIVATKRLDKQ